MREGRVRELLESWTSGRGALAARDAEVHAEFGVLFPGGVLDLEWREGDCDRLWAAGTAKLAFGGAPAAVRVAFAAADGEVGEVGEVEVTAELPESTVPLADLARAYGFDGDLCGSVLTVSALVLRADRDGLSLTLRGPSGVEAVLLAHGGDRVLAVETGAGRLLLVPRALSRDQVDGLGLDLPGPLEAGAWLAVDGSTLVPVENPRPAAADPDRRDGLGRALSVASARAASPVRRSRTRAIPVEGGFVVLAPPVAGIRGLWDMIGEIDGEHAISLVYDKKPLRIVGALSVQANEAPYRAVVGGLVTFSVAGGGGKRGLSGTGVGAVMFPQATGQPPSFFGFASLGAEPGLGIPAFRVNGVAAGFGWNSRLRLPTMEEQHKFPFLKALNDPAAIGGDWTKPVKILKSLTDGEDAWVTAASSGLWIAAGLRFTVAELVEGSALAVLQIGEDLTFALLGNVNASFPKQGDWKIANIDANLQVVVKPNAGEFSLEARLSRNSYILDKNCKLRGGMGLKVWYGDNDRAGDFVYTVGGYHHAFPVPRHYPDPPRLGFTWALGGAVTISGDAYFALTPRAAMAGGKLAVRYKAGIIKAWCTAKVDALIEWDPFYVDVSLSLSIGVEGSVKVLFVRITVRIEVGVSLRVWGPPTGGTARVKVWFISFTIGFGSERRDSQSVLDWPGFRRMLAEPGALARLRPGGGLISEGDRDNPGVGDWLVSAQGFTFGTDTAVPLTRIELNSADGVIPINGDPLAIHPMRLTGLTARERITVTFQGERVDLNRWPRTPQRSALPAQLWQAEGDEVPADGLLQNRLTGVTLTSPKPDYGRSTGYISEEAFQFDTMRPDGVQPLTPTDQSRVPAPRRPGGVIERITATVDDTERRTARARVHRLMDELDLNLGGASTDLPAYGQAARNAFTAEPMLIAAGERA